MKAKALLYTITFLTVGLVLGQAVRALPGEPEVVENYEKVEEKPAEEPEPAPVIDVVHSTAPKELEFTTEQWREDVRIVEEISSKGDYIAKYSGVCPKDQPENIFAGELKYLAAVGVDSPYPTPEHFAETAWNDYMHGRGFNPWQVGNFTVLGLPDSILNRSASLFIDTTAMLAYWDATWEEDRPYSGTRVQEWDELTARASAHLQWLVNTFAERCPVL